MKENDFFKVLTILQDRKSICAIHCNIFRENEVLNELRNLSIKLNHRLEYVLILNCDQYSSTQIDDRGLNASDLKKAIGYLIAEQTGLNIEQEWLIYFSTLTKSKLQVFFSTSSTVNLIFNQVGLEQEQFSSIDSYDHALCYAINKMGYDKKSIVFLVKNQGIIRCILTISGVIYEVKETALLDESGQSKEEQLIDRLHYYFRDYASLALIFVSSDSSITSLNLASPWSFEMLTKNHYSILSQYLGDMTGFNFKDYLPLIGAGLHHVYHA